MSTAKTILVGGLLTVGVGLAIAATVIQGGYKPNDMSGDTSVGSGGTGGYKVTVTPTAGQTAAMPSAYDTYVTIDTDNRDNWPELPKVVVIPAGQTEAEFSLTTAHDAVPSIDELTASNSNGSVGMDVLVE